MTEVVVTTGTIRRAKLQSNCHHQQTNTHLFYRSDHPSCHPTNSVRMIFNQSHHLKSASLELITRCLGAVSRGSEYSVVLSTDLLIANDSNLNGHSGSGNPREWFRLKQSISTGKSLTCICKFIIRYRSFSWLTRGWFWHCRITFVTFHSTYLYTSTPLSTTVNKRCGIGIICLKSRKKEQWKLVS